MMDTRNGNHQTVQDVLENLSSEEQRALLTQVVRFIGSAAALKTHFSAGLRLLALA